MKNEEGKHDPEAPSPPESENEVEELERKYEIVEGEEIQADEGALRPHSLRCTTDCAPCQRPASRCRSRRDSEYHHDRVRILSF